MNDVDWSQVEQRLQTIMVLKQELDELAGKQGTFEEHLLDALLEEIEGLRSAGVADLLPKFDKDVLYSHKHKSGRFGTYYKLPETRTALAVLVSRVQKQLDQHAQSRTRPSNAVDSERIFVVHGHDDAMKQAVARVLGKLQLTPVVLHEMPNQGRTIIEKFTDYADVGFAVVLLSPDDMAFPTEARCEDAKPRARQNVILELGYFLGRLGRDRVMALYRDRVGFEMPSDYSGVVFTLFQDQGSWQMDLVKELLAAGYRVDANRLFR